MNLGLSYQTLSFYYKAFPVTTTAQKMQFSIKGFFSKCDQIRSTADLVTFTEETLNRKLHFLCSRCDWKCLVVKTQSLIRKTQIHQYFG